MAKSIESIPIDTLVEDLEKGIVDINELNLAKSNHREAFKLAIESHPGLLAKVTAKNEKSFFAYALKNNPKYFVQLKESQYTDELAQIYIHSRLTENQDEKDNCAMDMLVQKSFDNKTVLVCSFITPEGDEIYYPDKELEVPISLKSSIMITLKLDNAIALIKKLDVHITQLGQKKIKSAILGILVNEYNSYLGQYIKNSDIGYYTLCTSICDIQKGFIERMGKVLKEYGLSVSEFIIKKFAIPKDIQFKIEDQALKIRQRRADVEADTELAMRSLESYEAKLAINQKYPEAEHTLTEYEKDLALKRYLIKIGRLDEEEVDRTIRIVEKKPQTDVAVEKSEDTFPDPPEDTNQFTKWFIVSSMFSLILSLITITIHPGIGFIVLGSLFCIFGTVAAFNTHKFLENSASPSTSELDDSVSDENDEEV